MNNFIQAINGFYTDDVYYTDTDSLYIENKHWKKLDKAGLVGKGLLQRKNDYKDGGIFYGLFLAPKKKYCLTKINLVFLMNTRLSKDLQMCLII